MKNFHLVAVFFFCPLISFSQAQNETESKLFPGNKVEIDISLSVLYDSLVNYTFTPENDSELYSKIIYHYNDIPKLSDKYTYLWDKVNNRWKNYHKSEYAYDSEGRTILDSYYEWNTITNNSWYGIQKYVNAYDQAGNQVLWESYQHYNTTSNTWDGSSRYEAVFGNEGQQLIRTIYAWSTFWINGEFTRMWSPVSKFENQYNERGTIDSVVIYGWNSTDSIYFKYEQKDYSYDLSDSLVSITDVIFDSEGKPSNNYKQDFTYDTTSVVCITHHWNSNTNAWFFYVKTKDVRNARGKLLYSISYTYNTSTESWEEASKYEYTYDENGNQNSSSMFEFDESANSWIGLFRTDLQFDDHNRQTKQVNKVWNTEAGDWEDDYVYETLWAVNGEIAMNSYYSYKTGYGDKTENIYNEDGIMIYYNEYAGDPAGWRFYGRGYYYFTPPVISGTGDPGQMEKITFYPNPVTSKMRIDGLTETSVLYIYDIRGQLVYSRQIENKDEIDLGHLPAGLYLTRINSSTSTYKGKFVKGL